MAKYATRTFLASLKALYPTNAPSTSMHPGALANPWALVAAVTFSASNVPEAVPVVFTHALEELRAEKRARGIGLDSQDGKGGEEARRGELVLARKAREAILQSGLLSGMPRVSATI